MKARSPTSAGTRPRDTAIKVTDNRMGDAPVLPHLLAQIPPNEKLASVSADGADDTKACHGAMAHTVRRPSFHLARMPRFGAGLCNKAMCNWKMRRQLSIFALLFAVLLGFQNEQT